jgi:hypothetical protein
LRDELAHVLHSSWHEHYAAPSCRIKPTSDLRLSVVGSMKKTVCRSPSTTDASLSQPT